MPRFIGKIRKVKHSDLPFIERIILMRMINKNSGQPDQKQITQFLKKIIDCCNKTTMPSNCCFFVAELQGEPVGIVGYRKPRLALRTFCHGVFMEILSPFVCIHHQKQGIGKALIKKIEVEAQKLKCKGLVVASNQIYKDIYWQFYDRLNGFRRVGIIENGTISCVWIKLL